MSGSLMKAANAVESDFQTCPDSPPETVSLGIILVFWKQKI